MNTTVKSRIILCFLLIFSLILYGGWGILPATIITYSLAGIASFFLNINRLLHIKKSSIHGIIYLLILFLPVGFFILILSALKNKNSGVIMN
ncbi:hypothetical protein H7Y21_02715 [Arenimonas sp.]|nr:hypothetical protein [Candidatus Parcubacteria bacterium]